MADTIIDGTDGHDDGSSRRDFIVLMGSALGAVAAAGAVWPLIDSMNPAADTLALSTTDVDLAPVAVGSGITVLWRGKPVFIRRRTPEEIKASEDVVISELRDPQTRDDQGKEIGTAADGVRVQKPEWLVLVGICTHLGCIPLGTKATETRGEFGGWYCPCHGSQYDTAGRIRKGPAPLNLYLPPYAFLTDHSIKIGK